MFTIFIMKSMFMNHNKKTLSSNEFHYGILLKIFDFLAFADFASVYEKVRRI